MSALAAALLTACSNSSSTSVVAPSTNRDRCTVTVSATAGTIGAAGGNGSVSVDTARDCQWSASADVSWLTITTSSGQGPTTIPFTVAANRTISSRRGGIAVNGQRVDITQEAATCDVSVSPRSVTVGPNGGVSRVTLTTQDFCTWTVVSHASWIVISSSGNGTGGSEVVLTIAPNNGPARSASVDVGGQEVVISQAAAPPECTFAIAPSNAAVSANPGSASVTVTAPPNCAWAAISEDPWISVAGGSGGSGNSSVTLQFAANSGAQRNGRVTIAGQTFTVSQAAALPSCTYAISPATATVGSDGSTVSVAVTSSASCPWSAVSTAPWIVVSGSGSGSANGVVSFQVASNPGAARTGSVTVAGQLFTVTQSAAPPPPPPPPCSFTVAPLTSSMASGGGSVDVTITTGSGCSWTATTADAWIGIGNQSGSGSATVGLTISSNTGSARTGTATIAGKTFTVTQSAPACSFTLNPTSHSAPAGAETTTVAVTTTNGCAWSTTGAPSWIAVSGGSGTGNGTVTLNLQANTGSVRTATLTIAGVSFTVTQAAPGCSFSINPTSLSPDASGGSSSVAVTTSSNCSWTTTGAPSWISVTGGSGSGNGTINLNVQPNTGGERSATLTIAGVSFAVTQAAACTFQIDPTSFSTGAGGGSKSVDVKTDKGCTWTTTGAPSWITVSGGSGTDDGKVTLTVQPNTGPARTATLTIAEEPFTVTQAAGCDFTINPTSFAPDAAGGSKAVAVTTSPGCTWNTTGAPSWITVTGGSGSGNGTVNVSVQANTGPARTATLTIAGESFTVNQASGCSFTINPTSFSPPASGGSTSVSVTTANGCSWTTTGAPSWITVSGGSGSGNGTVNVTVQANSGASRTATLTIAGQSFTVNQAGCTFTINPTGFSAPASGGSTSVAVTTQSGCTWNTTGAPAWVTVTGGSGTGNGIVNLTVASNSGGQRTATLTIAGQSYSITQAAAPCTYSVSPTTLDVNKSSQSKSIDITTASHCSWTAAVTTGSWLSITSGASGTGSGTTTVQIDANNGGARTGTLTIAGQTVTINQNGK